jgi:hypothetical protein
MRADLLDAQATVDWAITQFPTFQSRLKAWASDNINLVVREDKLKPTHNLYVAIAKEPLPFSFSVEAGAYINILRSALDILAVAIAKRHGINKLKQICFPIVESEAIFQSGNYKGAELVKGIPATEGMLIKSLKPYRGGNNTLWALHDLDITRKHRRLLSIGHGPSAFAVSGNFRQDQIALPSFTGPRTGWIEAGKDETPLILIAKDATQGEIHFSPDIYIAELDIGFSKPAIAALNEFANSTKSIIEMFDI